MGGTGDDYLNGGTGNDIYIFNLGDGKDAILDYDTANGNRDTILFSSGYNELMFSRSGNNLIISTFGTTDTVTVNSWYQGANYQIEEIKSSDGFMLTNLQVEKLIQAMAAFGSDNGMSWFESLTVNASDTKTVLEQFWSRQAV